VEVGEGDLIVGSDKGLWLAPEGGWGWTVLVFDFYMLAMLVVAFIGEPAAKSEFAEEPEGKLRAKTGRPHSVNRCPIF